MDYGHGAYVLDEVGDDVEPAGRIPANRARAVLSMPANVDGSM